MAHWARARKRCITDNVPDAIVDFKKGGKAHMVVVEFTRGMAEEAGEHAFKVATKTQAYPSTLRHIQRMKGLQGVEVLQQTYIMMMSCHWIINMRRWEEQLEWWGLQGPAVTETLSGCMQACVEGNHLIAKVQRSLLAGGTE